MSQSIDIHSVHTKPTRLKLILPKMCLLNLLTTLGLNSKVWSVKNGQKICQYKVQKKKENSKTLWVIITQQHL